VSNLRLTGVRQAAAVVAVTFAAASCGETAPEVRTDGGAIAVIQAAAAETLDQQQYRFHVEPIWPDGLEDCAEALGGLLGDTHYDYVNDAVWMAQSGGRGVPAARPPR
jgi:hypothetical protein